MTYTIDITTRTKKNNPSNFINNASAYIDSLVLSNLKRTAPYLFGKSIAGDKLEDGKTYTFTKKAKKNNKTIDITISGLKAKNAYTPDYDTFEKAVNYLLHKNGGDTYDFKLDDGTPVKLFDDELQIGYELFPLTEGTMFLYKTLSESSKKNIIDIYINI
jgi:hypothetical protein